MAAVDVSRGRIAGRPLALSRVIATIARIVRPLNLNATVANVGDRAWPWAASQLWRSGGFFLLSPPLT